METTHEHGERMAIAAADLTAFRQSRAAVDAALQAIRPQVTWAQLNQLDCAINALVADVQRAHLAALLHSISREWRFLPDVLLIDRDLAACQEARS